MRWGWRWRIEAEYWRASDSPEGWGKDWHTDVYSVADRTDVWRQLRRDPGVRRQRIAYRARALLGEKATHDAAGHHIEQHGGHGHPYEWHPCNACPGHVVLRCIHGCPPVLDPPTGRECTPFVDQGDHQVS